MMPNWKVKVKNGLAEMTKEFDHSMRCDKISETTRIYIRSEAGATSVVDAVLCGRFNEIFDKQHLPWVSAVQPTIPPSHSQNQASADDDEESLETENFGDRPDVCVIPRYGKKRAAVHQSEAKTKERLDVDNDQNPALEVAWNNAVAKPAGQRNYYEKNVVGAVAQEQGYMAARGSVTGIITTLENTWMVESDRAGNLQITEPVHCSTKGSPTEVSAMELYMYSVLRNINDPNRSKKYLTAESPGARTRKPQPKRAAAEERSGMSTAGARGQQASRVFLVGRMEIDAPR
ncbi:g52 [Coccomyxa viridis]|uniref:G52 protein n=1 Tax=Coccomyxa viridis TaxID=1274662 RepID=A0ABP1FLA6_9CHLO